jgi:S1-C subfamily serine protease
MHGILISSRVNGELFTGNSSLRMPNLEVPLNSCKITGMSPKKKAIRFLTTQLLAILSAMFLAGCAGTRSTINLSQPKERKEVFPMTATQADLVIQQAMSGTAGATLVPLPPPTIGYRGSITFALDTHTFNAIAIPIEFDSPTGQRELGYGFEVSHSGTFVLSGPARANTIYKRIIEAAKAIHEPVLLTSKQIADGRRSNPNGQSPTTGGENSPMGFGSGFFVTKDGYLITNNHVIKSAKKIEIRWKGKTYPATVVRTDESNDLALLRIEGEFDCLSIRTSSEVRLGESVFTVGYPNPVDQGNAPKMTDGRISSLYGLRDDASQFQISVPIQPGNSGGPLCSEKGELIGVTVSTLNPRFMLRRTGNLPQNVNFAVKSDYILILLKNVKGLELPKSSQSVMPNQSFTDIVENVSKATTMVLVY